MPASEFEEEVEFPDDPYLAALIYFGVMAYPEKGAGLAEGRGSKFVRSLQDYALWSLKKSNGIAFVRNLLGDPTCRVPQKRMFERTLEQGRRRIVRRIAAYDVLGSQVLNAFFRLNDHASRAIEAGSPHDAFLQLADNSLEPVRPEVWKSAMPSVREILSRSPARLSRDLALNRTASPKSKDLRRRAILPSVPVLHMAHGLNEGIHASSGQISGWNDGDQLLALLLNAELWIWDAIDTAEIWRRLPRFPGLEYVRSGRMINLVRGDQRR